MLPAIRAVITRNKVWRAVGFLLGWGLFNTCIWCSHWDDGRSYLDQGPVAMLLFYGVVAIGVTMILFGLFGLFTQHPKTIQLAGLSIMLVGIWNVALPFLLTAALGRGIHRLPDGAGGLLIIGFIQIVIGAYEKRSYDRIRPWLAEIATVSPEHQQQVKVYLKKFVKLDEDFFAQRLRATVADIRFLTPHRPQGYRGRICGEVAILVSKFLSDCLCLHREEIRAGRLSDRGVAKVRTAHGKHQLTMGPVSVICIKRWIGLQLTEKDVVRASRVKSATPALMAVLLADELPSVRMAVLESLQKFGKQPEVAALTAAGLDDPVPAVRAAALDASVDSRVDGHGGRAIELLADSETPVRQAAAAYLTAFPAPEAAGPLRNASQAEPDRKTQKQMEKALKAAEKLAGNPYAG